MERRSQEEAKQVIDATMRAELRRAVADTASWAQERTYQKVRSGHGGVVPSREECVGVIAQHYEQAYRRAVKEIRDQLAGIVNSDALTSLIGDAWDRHLKEINDHMSGEVSDAIHRGFHKPR